MSDLLIKSIITNRIGQQEVLWTTMAELWLTRVYPWSWHQGNKQFLNEVDKISKTEFNNCFIIHILEAFSYFELLWVFKSFRIGSKQWSLNDNLDKCSISFRYCILSCQLHTLLYIDWMLLINQLFHSKSYVEKSKLLNMEGKVFLLSANKRQLAKYWN